MPNTLLPLLPWITTGPKPHFKPKPSPLPFETMPKLKGVRGPEVEYQYRHAAMVEKMRQAGSRVNQPPLYGKPSGYMMDQLRLTQPTVREGALSKPLLPPGVSGPVQTGIPLLDQPLPPLSRQQPPRSPASLSQLRDMISSELGFPRAELDRISDAEVERMANDLAETRQLEREQAHAAFAHESMTGALAESGIRRRKISIETPLITSPTSRVAEHAIMRAMINGDVVSSGLHGLTKEQFIKELWTEYFKRQGYSDSEAAAATMEFLHAAVPIYKGKGGLPAREDVPDPLVAQLITKLDDALILGRHDAWDLTDAVSRMMRASWKEERRLGAPQYRKALINHVLDFLDVAAVADWDSSWISRHPERAGEIVKPEQAQQALELMGIFGPKEVRAALERASMGEPVTKAELNALVTPYSESTQAMEIRNKAHGKTEVFMNALDALNDRSVKWGTPATAFAQAESQYEDGVVRSAMFGVRRRGDPRHDVAVYYVTSGDTLGFYHETPKEPMVSRIVYGGYKFDPLGGKPSEPVKPAPAVKPSTYEVTAKFGEYKIPRVVEQERESQQRVKHPDMSYYAFINEVSSRPDLEVAFVPEAHNKLWPLLKVQGETAKGEFMPLDYVVEPPIPRASAPSTPPTHGPWSPVVPSVSRPSAYSGMPESMRFIAELTGRSAQAAPGETPKNPIASVLAVADAQDLANIFGAPDRTSTERYISSMAAKIRGRMDQVRRDAVAAHQPPSTLLPSDLRRAESSKQLDPYLKKLTELNSALAAVSQPDSARIVADYVVSHRADPQTSEWWNLTDQRYRERVFGGRSQPQRFFNEVRRLGLIQVSDQYIQQMRGPTERMVTQGP